MSPCFTFVALGKRHPCMFGVCWGGGACARAMSLIMYVVSMCCQSILFLVVCTLLASVLEVSRHSHSQKHLCTCLFTIILRPIANWMILCFAAVMFWVVLSRGCCSHVLLYFLHVVPFCRVPLVFPFFCALFAHHCSLLSSAGHLPH